MLRIDCITQKIIFMKTAFLLGSIGAQSETLGDCVKILIFAS